MRGETKRHSGKGAWANYDEHGSFKFVFCCCFVVFLCVATLARLTGWRWQPWSPGPGGYLSIIGEAKREAFTVAPIAFMG